MSPRTLRHGFDPRFGLYVRERGPAENHEGAETLLYLHGLGESALCFEELMADPRLAACRHLAPDLPGYGRSPHLSEPLGLAEQADLVARWLEARGIGPAVVIGHSMGGVSGLLLAERHPERVRAFVNVEGNVSLADCHYSGRAEGVSPERFAVDVLPRMLDEIYQLGLKKAPLRDYYASARHCDPCLYHLNAGELVTVSRSGELAPRLAALAVPLVYVAGRPDGTGEASLAQLDTAGVAWRALEPAGHWPFLDRHDAFVDLLLGFLEGLTEPAASR